MQNMLNDADMPFPKSFRFWQVKTDIIIIIVIITIIYLQSHVTPTQMITRQTRDDTPIITTRIITKFMHIIQTCDLKMLSVNQSISYFLEWPK